MEVGFIYWPVAPGCYPLRVVLEGSPEVGDVAIDVVDRLDVLAGGVEGLLRTIEEDGTGAKEWFHIVSDLAESGPNHVNCTTLTAEPREWGFVNHDLAPICAHCLSF